MNPKTLKPIEAATETAPKRSVLDRLLKRQPVKADAERPSFNEAALPSELRAMVDYWFAKSWRPPYGPSALELANAYSARLGKYEDGLASSVSHVFAGWMTDMVANAWGIFKESFNQAESQYRLFPEHLKGTEETAFKQVYRPALATIQTDFETDVSVVISESIPVWDVQNNVGFTVAFSADGYRAPGISVTVHEKNKDHAIAFVEAFKKTVTASNIYRGKQLTFSEGRVKFTKVVPAKFEDVVVDRNTMALVQSNTVALLARRDRLNRCGVGTNHATILAGRPGTGKTLLTRAVATALTGQVTTWIVTGKAFYGPSAVESFYDVVRAFKPSLVIFEDLDMMARDRNQSPHGNEILGELLNQMSGHSDNNDIITLASTNDMSVLDAAIADRPERMGTKIEIPLPDRTQIRSMFEKFAAQYEASFALSDAEWSLVLKNCDGFTGDYVKATLKRAIRDKISNAKASTEETAIVLGQQDLLRAIGEMLRSKQVGAKNHT